MVDRITIIYPMHNRLEYTKLTLPQLLLECHKNQPMIDKLVIYDDVSVDGSTEYVKELVENFKKKFKPDYPINIIVQKIGNSTFQTNDAFQKSKSKYLVKIDNDILIPLGYMKVMYAEMQKHDDIGFLMMPEVTGFPYVHPKELKISDRAHIGGVGFFRREIFDKLGEIPSNNRFFGFTHYQEVAKQQFGIRTCELQGTGNMNLDGSPVYSRVKEYEKQGWCRNLWKAVNSILDI